MNTKARNTFVCTLAVTIAMAAISFEAIAQVGTGNASAPAPKTLRQVEATLQQAREAIGRGDLQEAESLVEQAEGARVRYPLMHFGLTPQRVRRELNQAQRGGTTARRQNPFAKNRRAENPKPSDPFVASRQQEGRNPQASGTPLAMRPEAVSNEGIAPLGVTFPIRNGTATDAPQVNPAYQNVQPGIQPNRRAAQQTAQLSRGMGQAVPNPFAPVPKTTSATEHENQSPQTYNNEAGNENLAEQQYMPQDVMEAGYSLDDAEPIKFDNDEAMPATLNSPLPGLAPGRGTDPGLATDLPGEKYPQQTSRPSPVTRDHKPQALNLMSQAREAISAGDIESAQALALEASGLNIPESRFLPGEDRPSQLAWDLQQIDQLPNARFEAGTTISVLPPAPGMPTMPAAPYMAIAEDRPALHIPERDTTRNVQATTQAPGPEDLRFAQFPYQPRAQSNPIQPPPASLLENRTAQPLPNQPANGSLLDTTGTDEQLVARRLQADVTKRQSEAREMRESEPKAALKLLKDIRAEINDSKLSSQVTGQLVRRVDLSIEETEQYIEQHKAEIELDEQNEAVLADIERSRAVKVKVQEEIAVLVDKFNQLLDEQRYDEAEVIAQRARDLAPDELVVKQIWITAKMIRREKMNADLADRREEGNWDALNDVEESAVFPRGLDDGPIYDQKKWPELVKNRRGSTDRASRMTERELQIQRRLKTPVQLRYENRSLSEVMDGLSNLTGVNIHLDPRGLDQEGVTTDTPVTINLNQEISLKSALNLILLPMHLSYVIKDEVLLVTSEQLRDGELKTYTYNVADLVIPIPNFVPTNNIGLQGLLNDAYAAMPYGTGGGFGGPGPMSLVNQNRTPPSGQNGSDVLAQNFSGPGGVTPNPSVPMSSGPGGLGGGANADFDSLIDLIISTVAADTWAENGGGEAEVRPFPTNLSLVVSQTQAVHEEIAELLEQLRRLQDLQVTIEVRFIRLNDDFFERIGLDFDLNIEDRSGLSTVPGTPGALTPGAPFEPGRQSATVGIQQPVGAGSYPNYNTDLDIQFRQNSFDLSVPTIGGLGTDMGQFGFAILSDLEATFFIQAVQGDTRTNVLNAPKVTLFNGQQAFVADSVQMPFVISVIPVVGEFAAAQQPVIVVLNEGTLMSIQAVVSDDRRYVRLTVVPFFSQIGDVSTFTFEGSSSSTSSSSSSTVDDEGNNGDLAGENNAAQTVGTTVQLPTFQFIAVVTTVSVPDGGTVLLGGIKRLSEGRGERGIPLLSKVPYVNRLFRNIGIGRTTDSLMMMVTPRIIIQEEEEDKLGISSL